ncbi:hypothetical protein NP88_4090 [Burkholderia cepacia]|nr:hypothetical protein BURCENBC7_AP4838 [Burkholderia cenocepacia BC7]KIS46229.1 hypothetical protein NP88_4090 [Burkholderia cepacia]SPV10515.1 Uncharacterised protein [Burkholderia cenocepacia]
MQLGDIRFVVQTLAGVAIGQQLRDFRQDLEVLLGGLLGNEQEDQEADRLAVGRFERDRIGEADERGERVLEALDAAVRNRDTFAEPGRTEALAREQVVRDGAAGDAVLILEHQPGLFEDAFLAGDGEVDDDVLYGQDFG